jgi:glycosyltransferase involved in cell wall biosynthesis
MKSTDNQLVSVIIPVFNGERFIAEAIRSALAQNYEPVEIIVVDDGSTDATAKVVKIFGEKIRYIYQENKGVASARNTGLSASSGQYFAFLDADDLFIKDKLNIQHKQFDNYFSLGIAFGYATSCDLIGQIDQEIVKNSEKKFMLTLGSLLISKSVFDTIGGFDVEMRLADDLDFLLRAKESAIPIAIHPEVIMIRRFHDKNITNNKRNFIFYQLLAMKKAKNRREKLGWNDPHENREIKTLDEAINKWHTALRKPDDGLSR